MPSRKGCPNRNKEYLLKRLQDMFGDDFDPIINIAQNCVVLQRIADEHANGLITVEDEEGSHSKGVVDATSSAKAAIEGWDKVAQYVQPKLKAVELSSDKENPLTMNITYSGVKSDGSRLTPEIPSLPIVLDNNE